MNNIIEDKTQDELLESLIAEQAKATNEIKSAQADLIKVKQRLSFTLMLLNRLIKR